MPGGAALLVMFRRIEVPEGLCQALGTFDVFEESSCADPSCYTRYDVSFTSESLELAIP